MNRPKKRRPPVHPGEILLEEFMRPLGLSSYALAKALKVPAPRIHDLVIRKRGLSTDTARRLAAYFNTSVELWMRLQNNFELETAREAISDEKLKELVGSRTN